MRTTVGFLFLSLLASSVAFAQTGGIAYGPLADPNFNNDGFNGTAFDLDATGTYTYDDTLQEGAGNDVVGFKPLGVATLPGDSGIAAAKISVGENGNDGFDSMNPDVMSTEPANSVFADMGQTRLENGNYIRMSTWLRLDENDVPQVAPQIEPIFKLEFWTEALSNNGDFNLNFNPVFGDRIYDTDQNGIVPFADQVDINNDGSVSLGGTPSVTATTSWQLVVTDYVVDDSTWEYTDPDNGTGPAVVTAADVEEIRATMFVGDWTNADLTNGGTFFLDHPMVEIYKTQGDAPGTVPNPTPGTITGGIDGDFNDDGVYDCLDVDGLVGDIAGQSNTASFDLDGNGTVDTADLDAWLLEAGEANIGAGQSYLLGDANLDGVVDVGDFNIWNGSKFSSTPEWCNGDFNADGVVDVGDFNIWNGNKFQSSDVASVPEPGGAILLLMGLFAFRRRARK